MLVDLESFTVFNDIRERISQITERQVELTEKRLGKPAATEMVVGLIGESTRILWTLARALQAEILKEDAAATALIDENLVRDHKERSMVLSQVMKTVERLMWAQARFDTGYWADESIGIRSGWVLVQMQENPLGALFSRLGLPIPGGENE